MKSYGVTIQMKPVQQYFHMVLFIQYVVLTFESVDEIPWCDHSNETSPSFHKISENWKFWRFKLGHFWGEIQVWEVLHWQQQEPTPTLN